MVYDNGFKIQWEDFIRHIVRGTPWKHDLIGRREGRAARRARRCKSWKERRWLEVPDLSKESVA